MAENDSIPTQWHNRIEEEGRNPTGDNVAELKKNALDFLVLV